MDWTHHRTETLAASTPDFVCVITRTVHTDRTGKALVQTPWHGSVLRDMGTASLVVASATDYDKQACMAALERFVTSYELAKERDPQPATEGDKVAHNGNH